MNIVLIISLSIIALIIINAYIESKVQKRERKELLDNLDSYTSNDNKNK